MKYPVPGAISAFILAVYLIAPIRAGQDDRRNQVVWDIKSSPGHPRNTEGSFVMLRSGRIEFYFTQFYGGAHDESPARIAKMRLMAQFQKSKSTAE